MLIEDVLNLPPKIADIFKKEIYFQTFMDRDEMISKINLVKSEEVSTFLKHEINLHVELYRQTKPADANLRLKTIQSYI